MVKFYWTICGPKCKNIILSKVGLNSTCSISSSLPSIIAYSRSIWVQQITSITQTRRKLSPFVNLSMVNTLKCQSESVFSKHWNTKSRHFLQLGSKNYTDYRLQLQSSKHRRTQYCITTTVYASWNGRVGPGNGCMGVATRKYLLFLM